MEKARKALMPSNVLWRISKKFQFAADRVIPNSFVFCIILTIVVFLMAFFITGTGPVEGVVYWYNGLWSLLTFALQMICMVVFCSMAGNSPQVAKVMGAISDQAKTPGKAYLLVILVSVVTGWINWAFGFIAAPILAIHLARKVKGVHFPLMIVIVYTMVLITIPATFSTSVVALLATPGHFMESTIGVIPANLTAFSPVNLVTVGALILAVTILTLALRPPEDEVIGLDPSFRHDIAKPMEIPRDTIADKLNASKLLFWIVKLIGVTYMVQSIITTGFMGSLTLNFMIFFFIIADMFLYKTPIEFITALKRNITLASQLAIQFIFYGGLMGLMAGSGLTRVLADALASIATGKTIYWFTYVSASLVNLFVPSQGGQWAVQGPIAVQAAQAFDADIPNIAVAFMLGDEATNLLQPLWALPTLAIAKLKLKSVWGLMAFIWVFIFIITSICLLILPQIFIK